MTLWLDTLTTSYRNFLVRAMAGRKTITLCTAEIKESLLSKGCSEEESAETADYIRTFIAGEDTPFWAMECASAGLIVITTEPATVLVEKSLVHAGAVGPRLTAWRTYAPAATLFRDGPGRIWRLTGPSAQAPQ